MPTHGKGLSSGSIDELTLKDDGAGFALGREGDIGGQGEDEMSVCRCCFKTCVSLYIRTSTT